MFTRRSVAHAFALLATVAGIIAIANGRGEQARPYLLATQAVLAALGAWQAWIRLNEEPEARAMWRSLIGGTAGLAVADILATAWKFGWVNPAEWLGEAGWAIVRVGPAALFLLALWFWPRRVQRRTDQLLGVLDGLIFASAGFIVLGWYSLSRYLHDPAIPLDRRLYQTIAAVLGAGALGLVVGQHRQLLPSTRRRFAEYQVAVFSYGLLTIAEPLLYPLGRVVPLAVFNLTGVLNLLFVFRVTDAPLQKLPEEAIEVEPGPDWMRSAPIIAVVVVATLSLIAGDTPDPLLVGAGAVMMGALLWRERIIARELRELSQSLERKVAARTRELEDSQEALVQAQRLEAVGKMAGSVAHDFRNVLMGIRAIVELERDDLPDDHAMRDSLQHVLKAVDRGADLTKDLITFARREPSSGQSTSNVDSVVRDNIPLWRRQVREGIGLESRLDAAGVQAAISEKHVSRILTNLILNARDAIAAAGTITVSTAEISIDDPRTIAIRDAHAGRFARITVSDTGSGMSADIAAQVFEPYFTTKPEGKGTGLGLSTVYGLVRQVDGFIHMHTAPGEGTRFEIYLPLAS